MLFELNRIRLGIDRDIDSDRDFEPIDLRINTD